MSYDPLIVIYKADLDKKADDILSHQYGQYRKKPKTDAAKEKQEAWDKLESILQDRPFKIKNVAMILVKVELTTKNKVFRKLLDDLEIEYTTID